MPRVAFRPRGQGFVALLVSVALLSSCTSEPEPKRPQLDPNEVTGDLIAFSADLNGHWDFYDGDADVFVIGLDGGPAHNLTRHPANDFSPEWSPDGSRIAFRTDRDGNHEIYVMEADGSDPINLTRTPDDEERSPAWSPDGDHIAFSSDRDHDRDIYVTDADGSNVQRLALPGLQEYPTWSPDGAEIAFTSFCASCSNAALVVMNVDGTNARQIVTSASWPDWSPDGSAIAFDTRARDGTAGVHAIAPTAGATSRPLVQGLQGDWSPDGSQLTYTVATGMLHEKGSNLLGDLYVAGADGQDVLRLTDTPEAFEFEPTWRPSADGSLQVEAPVSNGELSFPLH